MGTNNLEARAEAAHTLIDLVGEDNLGTIVIYGNEFEDWFAGVERTPAAGGVLTAATKVTVQDNWEYADGDLEALRTAMQNADPKLVGVLGMFSNAYLCAEAAIAAGVIDDLKIAAFDFDLETSKFMEKGQIQAAHTQRQYYIGLMVPYILYASVVLGIDETKDLLCDIVTSDGILDTGLDVITTDNLAEYDAYLEQMGIAK